MPDPFDEGPITEILQKMNRDLINPTTKMLFLPMVSSYAVDFISKKFGEVQKIGVFGPFPNGGEQILHIIAQKIAGRGFMAIMGNGFYLPESPTIFHPITEMLPQAIINLMPLPIMEFYIYRYLLPSVIHKATMNLYPVRTTAYELEGCLEEKKPVLGYVINSLVVRRNDDCPFLQIESSNSLIGKECIPIVKSCPKQAPNPPHCSFSDIVDIPFVQKQWFWFMPDWRMIAMNEIDRIDFYLDSFLPVS